MSLLSILSKPIVSATNSSWSLVTRWIRSLAAMSGFELLSTQAVEDMVTAEAFETFDTHLVPGANKIGSVSLYKKVDGSNPQGQLLEESFTRPNTPEDASKSGATAINQDGTLRVLAEDEPMWSYVDGEWVLEIAPQAKNLEINSNGTDGSNVGGLTRASGGDSPTVAGNEGVTVAEHTGTADPFFFKDYTVTSGMPVTFSMYIRFKNGIPATRQIKIQGSVDLTGIVLFNQDGTASEIIAGFDDFGMTSIGNGWYRIHVTDNAISGTQARIIVRINDNGNNSYIGTGIDVYDYYNRQVEELSYPTSAIVTTGTALTRNAPQIALSDLITKGLIGTGGEFSLKINFSELITPAGSGNLILFKNSGTSILTLNWYNANRLRLFDNVKDMWATGLTTSGFTGSVIITSDARFVSVYWEGGTEILNYDLGSINTIDDILLSSNSVYYQISKFKLLPTVLSEAEAIAEVS